MERTKNASGGTCRRGSANRSSLTFAVDDGFEPFGGGFIAQLHFSVVENRRLRTGKMAQRRVLYLGEINDSQQAAWRKTLEVFVESEQRFTELSLFPEDREIPRDAVNSIQIKLDQVELHRPRAGATAGWAVSSGASCGWTSFGVRSCRRSGRPCPGRGCCSCWW
jgi:hypothetical protein